MIKRILIIALILILVTIILSVFISPYFLAMLLFLSPLSIIYTEARKGDEREKFIRYRAGYLALQLSIFLFVILFIQEALVSGKNPAVIHYLLIIFPIMVYTLFLLSESLNLAKSGRIILYVFGGWWILFSILSHGLTLESLIESPIGIGFLIPAFLSYRFKRVAGFISLLYATFLLVFLARSFKEPIFSATILFILPVPLYYAGVIFLRRGED
ncbi:hypothetical protein KAX08_05985 [candidate division WOR-3 bacterium]|nr:hypothetical protein [candidate division WOR-3 bacterium]